MNNGQMDRGNENPTQNLPWWLRKTTKKTSVRLVGTGIWTRDLPNIWFYFNFKQWTELKKAECRIEQPCKVDSTIECSKYSLKRQCIGWKAGFVSCII